LILVGPAELVGFAARIGSEQPTSSRSRRSAKRLGCSEDGESTPVEIVKILPDRLAFKIEGREDKRYVVPFDE